MILHLNDSERRAVLRAFDSRLSTLSDRRRAGALRSHEEADVVLVNGLRRELVAYARARHERADVDDRLDDGEAAS